MTDTPGVKQWIIDQGLAAKPGTSPDAQRVEPPAAPTPAGTNPCYVSKAYDDEMLNLALAQPGTRNQTLNDVAFNLRRFVDSGDIPEADLHGALTATALTLGLTAAETEATIRSAWRGSVDKVGAAIVPLRREIAPAFTIAPDDGPAPVDAELAPAYTDFAALLADGLPDPPAPTVLARTDRNAILYPGKRNELYGDPEDGKTMVALAAAAEQLRGDGRVLFLDLDNNGPAETAQRLLMLGAPEHAVTDPNRLRHIEPDDPQQLLQIVDDCTGWATYAMIDCVGELIPLCSGKSDSSDDYTRIMQRVSTPLEHGGACVVLIDHPAKGHDSRQYGAGGTMAKRRAVSGVSINVVRAQTFVPGRGGAAELWINKDRPGGLRQHCPPGSARRQFAGTFTLDPPGPDGTAAWTIRTEHVDVTVIDPVAEQHFASAEAIGHGAKFTARELAAGVHDLPPREVRDSQRVAAQRAAEHLTTEGRFELVPGTSTRRWRVSDDD